MSSPLTFSHSVIPGTYTWQGNESIWRCWCGLLPSTSEPWKGPWKGPLQMGRRKDSAGSCPLGTLRVGLPFKVDTLPRGPLRCLPRSYRVLGSALPGMFKGLGVLLLHTPRFG